MAQDTAILRRLFNAFDPFQPLPAGDPLYVDCQEVRGDVDIREEIGREILFSNRMTYQLYAGHRGAGKSTELLRLQQYLDNNGCYVVYFAADDQDIEPEDAEYTDILLACTRHLVEALHNIARPDPLLQWLKERWEDLKDLLATPVSLESLAVETQISQFSKLTANLRAEPSLRQKIRDRVNPHTKTLIEALNQFIQDAKQHLPKEYSELVVIADNLDRIVPVEKQSDRTNHDQIFIDRSGQLKALDCHIVYTVPISLLYTNRAADMRNIYGDAHVLPMIMMHTEDNKVYQAGLDKVKEIITRRVSQVVTTTYSLEKDIFESSEILEQVCFMSGGHVRELMLLLKAVIKRTDKLPISLKSVERAIAEAQDTYRRGVEENQWQTLANVSCSKSILNDEVHRNLLFYRYVLEYRCLEPGKINRWYDVHPLIKRIKEFQEALNQVL